MSYLMFTTEQAGQGFCNAVYNKLKGSIPSTDKITKNFGHPMKSEVKDEWGVYVPTKFNKHYTTNDKNKFINSLPSGFVKTPII